MSLYDAALAGDLERVTQLVEQGEDKNQVGGGLLETVLSIAVDNGYLDVIQYLVEQGADMEKADNEGWTPLIVASWRGHTGVTRYLLERPHGGDALPLRARGEQGQGQ